MTLLLLHGTCQRLAGGGGNCELSVENKATLPSEGYMTFFDLPWDLP